MGWGSGIAVAVVRPAAAALIGPPAWELPYAVGTALKSKKIKTKNILDLFLTIPSISHISPSKSSYMLPSGSCSSKKDWTLGMLESWSTDSSRTFSITYHCFSLLASYILSDHLTLPNRTSVQLHLLYVAILWTNWHWLETWKDNTISSMCDNHMTRLSKGTFFFF